MKFIILTMTKFNSLEYLVMKGICSCENIAIILRGKSLFEIEGNVMKKNSI